MSALVYLSGEPIQAGDHINYHGEEGHIEFVVTQKGHDPALAWYREQFPGGGVMIFANSFGSVFVEAEGLDDFLEFAGRSTLTSERPR